MPPPPTSEPPASAFVGNDYAQSPQSFTSEGRLGVPRFKHSLDTTPEGSSSDDDDDEADELHGFEQEETAQPRSQLLAHEIETPVLLSLSQGETSPGSTLNFQEVETPALLELSEASRADLNEESRNADSTKPSSGLPPGLPKSTPDRSGRPPLPPSPAPSLDDFRRPQLPLSPAPSLKDFKAIPTRPISPAPSLEAFKAVLPRPTSAGVAPPPRPQKPSVELTKKHLAALGLKRAESSSSSLAVLDKSDQDAVEDAIGQKPRPQLTTAPAIPSRSSIIYKSPPLSSAQSSMSHSIALEGAAPEPGVMVIRRASEKASDPKQQPAPNEDVPLQQQQRQQQVQQDLWDAAKKAGLTTPRIFAGKMHLEVVTGRELVDFLLAADRAATRSDATALCTRLLVEDGWLSPLSAQDDDDTFNDDHVSYYEFRRPTEAERESRHLARQARLTSKALTLLQPGRILCKQGFLFAAANPSHEPARFGDLKRYQAFLFSDLLVLGETIDEARERDDALEEVRRTVESTKSRVAGAQYNAYDGMWSIDGSPVGCAVDSDSPHHALRGGAVKLAVWFDTANTLLRVTVLEARGLPAASLGGVNPYIKTYVRPDEHKLTKRKTKVARKTTNPVYGESFPVPVVKEDLQKKILEVVSEAEPFRQAHNSPHCSHEHKLCLQAAWDYERAGKNTELCSCTIPLLDIPMDVKITERDSSARWWALDKLPGKQRLEAARVQRAPMQVHGKLQPDSLRMCWRMGQYSLNCPTPTTT